MNIEKTISEQAVSDILTPMLESQDRIVTEDVAPLFDQATGLDTPPASGTVTTTIEESRSVITAIIRKAWTATLTMLGGASVISYIAAAYTYLRNRLQGNETYGIPDRRSEISATSPLAANLALLNDRKIGGADVADGMSLQHILGSDEGLAAVTNLSDNNEWVMNRGISFPNVNRIENNAQSFFKEIDPAYTIFGGQHKELILPNMEWTTYPAVVRDGNNTYNRYNRHTLSQSTVIETLYAPKLRGVSWIVNGAQGLEVLSLPELEFIGISGYDRPAAIHNCANLKEINLPKLSYLQGWYSFGGIWANCPKLEKVVLGTLHQWYLNAYNDRTYNSEYLVHLEIGAGTNCSLNFGWWSPTLDSSNLQQFLSNFRSYIALRLTDNGSGKTLTLSKAVRNAIHAAEATYGIENIIITQKGWTISPAPN